jgi:subtilisin family serine protease
MFRSCAPRARVLASLAAAVCLLAAWAPGGGPTPQSADDSGETDGPAAEEVTQKYIVVLQNNVSSVQTAAIQDVGQYGIEIEGIYQNTIKGYTAQMTEEELARLTTDPDVAYIEPDRLLYTSGQVIPTGIQRIAATTNTNLDIDATDDARIDVDVAVIDTGVNTNVDLNLVSRVDCSPGTCINDAGSDDNGHGTHVAGTIGAIDNGVGVVGVAPGARIHGLKVCNAYGECPNSAILAAVDWVTARSATIEVVNMSLGGAGVNNPLNQAIARSVDAGVVYVVAAGNNTKDAKDFSPASSPDVITVSAVADSDGKPGALGGPPACRQSNIDDRIADFSNYGSVVDIAAPGVCVLSTWKDGTLKLMSGTSMASPHVAGAAAVLTSGSRDPLDRAGVMAVKKRMLDSGTFLWSDTSPDGIKEPFLNLVDKAQFPPPLSATPTTPAKPAPSTVFTDNLEGTAGGWVVNAGRTDTATGGKWQRADPAATSYANIAVQLPNTTSGVNDLVTGAVAGADVGAGDIDGGVTSIRSGLITLPSSGALTLTARYYFSHLNNATKDDYFRINVMVASTKTKVFEVLGAPLTNKAGAWGTATIDLKPYAGKQIRLLIEAADVGAASMVEAAVDDVKIVQQL